METVSALSRQQILDYKKRYYHPPNVLVSVSGPVRHEEVVRLAESQFGRLGARPVSEFKKAAQRQRKPQTHFLEKKTEQTHFVIGFHGFSRFHPDRYNLGILNVILGANMSSRLFEEVREKRGLAYEIRSGVGFFSDTGSVTISAGVEGKKAPDAVRVILRELEKLCEREVTEGELRRAKDYFMSQLSMALEDTLEHLLWVGERLVDKGELPDPEKIRKRIEAVTRGNLRDAARQIFRNCSLNLALIGPVAAPAQKEIRKDFELHER